MTGALADLDPLGAANYLLGSLIRHDDVEMRIVEVEAYGGGEGTPFPDPAAHGYRGENDRNRVMFGPGGHLYVYRSYGIHLCVNVSYGPAGICGGVLLRAAEVTRGAEIVQQRRSVVRQQKWACGPGNLGEALGVSLSDNGWDVFDPASPFRVTYREVAADRISSGPRVGVSRATTFPWRLWISDSPAVSQYRAGGGRRTR